MKFIERLCWVFFGVCAFAELRWMILKTVFCFDWGLPDWGTWIGAIGTVLTLVGTIWLATEQNRQKRRDSFTAARLTAANVYFQTIHNESNIACALRALRTPFEGKLQDEAGVKEVLDLVEHAISLLRLFRPLNLEELQTLAILQNDEAVHLAAAQGRISSTLALLEGINIHSGNLSELLKNLTTNIQILTVAELSLRRGSKALGELVDLIGVQAPP